MQYLLVQMILPPILDLGIFQALLNWNSFQGPASLEPAKLNITVSNYEPIIRQLIPSSASSNGGDNIKVYVSGLPYPVDTSSIMIFFDNASSSLLSDPVSDTEGLLLSVTAPALKSCSISVLRVEYYLKHSNAASILYAAAPFLSLNPDAYAACIQGCNFSTGVDRLQEALISVQIKAAEVSGRTPMFEITCSYILDYAGSSYQACISNLKSVGLMEVCGLNRDLLCMNLTVNYGLQDTSESQAILTYARAFLEIRVIGNRLFCVPASVMIVSGPKVRYATFVSGFGSVEIWFDQDIAVDQTGKTCLSLFRSIAQLGQEPSCVWNTYSNLVVILGNDASLVPGDQLTLIGPLLSLTNAVHRADITFSVMLPLRPALPKIRITGPNVISICDTAFFRIETSAARMNFFWGSYNDAALNSYLQSLSPANTVQIYGSMLKMSQKYTIFVNGVYKFGLFSDTVTHSLTLSDENLTLLEINFPPTPYYNYANLTLVASATYSRCTAISGFNLEFIWLLNKRSGDRAEPEILMSAGPIFNIDLGALNESESYAVAVYALSFYGSSVSAGAFNVGLQAVKAAIMGGDRNVFIKDTITLDASISVSLNPCRYDLNSAIVPYPSGCNFLRPLRFLWHCLVSDQGPCRWQNGSLAVFESLSKVNIRPDSLSLSGSEVQVIVTVFDNNQFATSTTIVQISSSPTLDVQIKVAYKTSQGFALQGIASSSNLPSFVWSIISPSAAFTNLCEKGSSLTGRFQPNFVVAFTSPSVFQPGTTYTIQLLVSTASSVGITWYKYKVPFPPSGGICSVAPLNGIALLTEFKIACAQWTSDNMPLKYRFSGNLVSASPAAAQNEIIWSPLDISPGYSMYFVAGVYSVVAMIVDADGYSSVSASILVNVSSGLSSSGLPQSLSSISDFLSALQKSSQTSRFLSLIGSISSYLNSDNKESSCLSGTCRRLLSSSKAYRLALRKLLLQKLSPISSSISTSATGPTYVKSLKSIALNPSELDHAGTLLANSQFDVSSGVLDTVSLRSGSLIDVVKLGLLILFAARPNLDADSLDPTYASVLHTILKASTKYSTTMLAGEFPFVTNVSDVSLQVSGYNLSSNQLSQPAIGNTLINNSADTGLSVSIIRLNPVISTALADTKDVRSETLGIQVISSNAMNMSSTFKCSEKTLYCIRFGVGLQILNYIPPEVKCLRWGGIFWDDSVCEVNNISFKNSSLTNIIVTCACTMDGIFKVSTQFGSAQRLRSAPLLATAASRVHASAALYFVIGTASFLVLMSLTSIKWGFGGVSLISKAAFEGRSQKFFTESKKHLRSLYGSQLCCIHDDTLEKFLSGLETVTQGYFPRTLLQLSKTHHEAAFQPILVALMPPAATSTENVDAAFREEVVSYPQDLELEMPADSPVTFRFEGTASFITGDTIWYTSPSPGFYHGNSSINYFE